MKLSFGRRFFWQTLLLLSGLAVSAEAGTPRLVIDPAQDRTTACSAAWEGTEVLPARSPRFAISFLPERFEVTVTVPFLPGELRTAGKKDDEEAMFLGDTAEFLVSPDPGSGTYFHIAMDPEGLCYTARKRDTSWEPRISRSVTKHDGFWEMRLGIPYAALGTTRPRPGTVWRANFAAKVPSSAGGKLGASWSGARDFHRIEDMGELVFSSRPEETPRLLSWKIGDGVFEAVLFVPEKYAGSRARCRLGEKTWPARGSGLLRKWEIPVGGNYLFPKNFIPVEIALETPGGTDKLSGRIGVPCPHTLETDSFHYTPDMTQVRFIHTFPQPAELRLKTPEGRILFRGSAPAGGAVPLAGLAPGRYTLELRSGTLRTSRLIVLTRTLSPRPVGREEKFEITDGLFRLGGKPVFLAGGSSTPRAHLQGQHVFNLKSGNCGSLPGAVSLRGLPTYMLIRRRPAVYRLKPEAEKIIDARLAETPPGNREICRLCYEAQIPLVAGDEKSPRPADAAAHYARQYAMLKKRAPERYFSIHVDRPEALEKFIGSCDVFEYASWRSSYARNMMRHLVGDMERLREKAGKKPVIFWLGGSIPDGECRLAEELRAAAYCAVACGLNGVVIHLGHGGLRPERRRLWSVISGIAAEMQDVYEDFAAGTPEPGFVTELSGDFFCAARRCGGKVRVIVVNMRGSEQRLRLKTRSGETDEVLTPFEPVSFAWETGEKPH